MFRLIPPLCRCIALTLSIAVVSSPAFAAQLTFLRDDGVWVASGTGSSQAHVVADFHSPALSPTGQTLLAHHASEPRLWTMDLSGANASMAFDGWAGQQAEATSAFIGPDSQSLYYSDWCWTCADTDVFRSDLNRGPRRRLLSLPGHDYSFGLSKDGERGVFLNDNWSNWTPADGREAVALFRVNGDGTNPELIDTGYLELPWVTRGSRAAISPDGTRIAFEARSWPEEDNESSSSTTTDPG